MNVARFNFSHGSHPEHKQRLDALKSLRAELDLPVAAMLDTKGPEVRLRSFDDGSVTLRTGQEFTLTTRDVVGDQSICSVTYADLPGDVKAGGTILLDDGLVRLTVLETTATDIRCRVENDGVMKNNKGVNVPGVRLSMPYMSQRDREDILFGVEQGFDFIAASFVRTADDVREIRRLLDEADSSIQIIAKIENQEGVSNLAEILSVADGIMVARGDMGVEIDFTEIPIIQKDMIAQCVAAGKPVITATQMLDSMIEHPRPTRAEITDVANAIYDGTSAIMLSGESAAGKYPVEAVRTMATIARRTEEAIDYRERFYHQDYAPDDVTAAISHATCTTAYDLSAAAIISITQSGQTARMCSRFRPGVPIIACTTSEGVYRQLSLAWGVTPLVMKMESSTDALFDGAVEIARRAGLITDGDLVVLTAGVPLGIPGTTNLIKVALAGYCLVQGRGLSGGRIVGNLCVAKNAPEALRKFKQDDILVVPEVERPIWGLLDKAAGIIIESDTLEPEAADLLRRREIPVIIGARGATTILRGGISVGVDASQGLVYNAASLNNRKPKGEE